MSNNPDYTKRTIVDLGYKPLSIIYIKTIRNCAHLCATDWERCEVQIVGEMSKIVRDIQRCGPNGPSFSSLLLVKESVIRVEILRLYLSWCVVVVQRQWISVFDDVLLKKYILTHREAVRSTIKN